MKTAMVLYLMLVAAVVANAQEERSWEEAFYDVMSNDGYDSDESAGTAMWEEALEWLSAMADSPLDINVASREELEQLPFLSAAQIDDIEEYHYRYGKMKSMNELYMIKSLDAARIELMKCFLVVKDEDKQQALRIKDLLAHSRQQLTAYCRVPFYTRRGDRNGYLGYKYKHWVQYDLTADNRVRAGLVGAQDAGEPFLSNSNKAGYDFYSYYFQVKNIGRVENAVVGKYRISAGMGLVLSNAFGLGKLATLQSLGRGTSALRPHSSRSSADYFQGAAATVRMAEGLRATAFVSYRPFDATLNKDGEAQTLLTSGYHRTPTELSKKNNTHASAAGLRLAGRLQRLRVALNAVYTHFDRRLQPDTRAIYRRNYPQGNDFVNISADYSYHSRLLTVNGETAVDGHGALATINTGALRVSDVMQIMVLQRFYSYRYAALYARSLSETGRVQNESGVMGGLSWQPTPRLQLQAYSDYAYSAWPRYRVSQPGSHSSDNFVAATYSSDNWSLTARYRLHYKQQDNTEKTALNTVREQRARVALTIKAGSALSSTTQGDVCLSKQQSESYGYALSQHIGLTRKWLSASASATYFNTDDTSTRIYVYERSPLYSFTFPSLSGQGLRYSLLARAALGRQLWVMLKMSVTNYFDRAKIGTGYQQTDGSSQTALELQCRWRIQ